MTMMMDDNNIIQIYLLNKMTMMIGDNKRVTLLCYRVMQCNFFASRLLSDEHIVCGGGGGDVHEGRLPPWRAGWQRRRGR